MDYDSEIIKHDEQQQFLNDHHGSYYQEENFEIHQPIIDDHHVVVEDHHEVIDDHHEVIEDHHEVIDDHHEIIEDHHEDPHEQVIFEEDHHDLEVIEEAHHEEDFTAVGYSQSMASGGMII